MLPSNTRKLQAAAYLAAALLLGACGQSLTVSVNDNPVYDPQGRLPGTGSVNADLQGCINLAMRQQNVELASELTVLSCANAGIVSLENIASLQHLRFLDLASNGISNLTPLTAMSQLSALVLIDNAITDIRPLMNVPTLSSVNLLGNNNIPCNQLDRLQQRLGDNLLRPQTCRN